MTSRYCVHAYAPASEEGDPGEAQVVRVDEDVLYEDVRVATMLQTYTTQHGVQTVAAFKLTPSKW